MKPRWKDLLKNFARPTQLPATSEEEMEWQTANQSWWEGRPMRYEWRRTAWPSQFTHEFYEDIDRRFFSAVASFLPWRHSPFEQWINSSNLGQADVLEIGVGLGSHATLLSLHGRSYVGIDLTAYAAEGTWRKFRLFGRRGAVMQMDAELMAFRDETFDFIWSWGVIHHSANTRRVLAEMRRVLRPGGKAVVMVYRRGFWNYYLMAGLLGGLLSGELLRTMSLHKAVQLQSDGALARYYSIAEWLSLTSPFFETRDLLICGQKTDGVPLPAGRLKELVSGALPDAVWRLLMSRCRFGGFLVASMVRR